MHEVMDCFEVHVNKQEVDELAVEAAFSASCLVRKDTTSQSALPCITVPAMHEVMDCFGVHINNMRFYNSHQRQ